MDARRKTPAPRRGGAMRSCARAFRADRVMRAALAAERMWAL
jgi:hypothetical protein